MIRGLLFAVVATVLNTVAGMLQSDATRHVTSRRPLAAQPRFLTGLVFDGVGWLSTVVALQILPVFLVQAVLAGTIALTAVGSRIVYGTPLRRIDRAAIGACVCGLILVAVSAGTQHPTTVSWWTLSGLATGAGLVATAAAGSWDSGRAWPLGVAAGLGFGGTSLAVRAVHLGGRSGWPVLTQPAVLVVVVFWAIGLAAYSRALALTSVARLTAVMVVTATVVPGLAGIVLLGDTVRAGWWWPMAAGLVLAVTGVAVLATSPALDPPPPAVHRPPRRAGLGGAHPPACWSPGGPRQDEPDPS
jgi:drug/metabolite transporter (DMT)-like permease